MHESISYLAVDPQSFIQEKALPVEVELESRTGRGKIAGVYVMCAGYRYRRPIALRFESVVN